MGSIGEGGGWWEGEVDDGDNGGGEVWLRYCRWRLDLAGVPEEDRCFCQEDDGSNPHPNASMMSSQSRQPSFPIDDGV